MNVKWSGFFQVLLASTLILLSCSGADERENGAGSNDTAYLNPDDMESLNGLDPSLTFRYGYPEEVLAPAIEKKRPTGEKEKSDGSLTDEKKETAENETEKTEAPSRKFTRVVLPPDKKIRDNVLNKIQRKMPRSEYLLLLKELDELEFEKKKESSNKKSTSPYKKERVLVLATETDGASSYLMKKAEKPLAWREKEEEEKEPSEISPYRDRKEDRTGGANASEESSEDARAVHEEETEKSCPENTAPRASRKFAAEILRTKNKTTRLFSQVNSRARDYRLRQSPREQDTHFYLMSNRSIGYFRVYRLDSVVEEGAIAMKGEPEALEIPFLEGNVIGYDLCVDPDKKIRLVYSQDCQVFESISDDGLNFEEPVQLGFNTDLCERDPAYSDDCNTLVYTRSLESAGNVSRMSEVYITDREDVDSDFTSPKKIPNSYNYEGSNTPFLLKEGKKSFIFFVKNLGREELVSSEMTSAGPSHPEKVEILIQGKYPFCSTRKDTGLSCFTSLWVDGYEWDLFQMNTARSIPLNPESKKAGQDCDDIPLPPAPPR